MGDITDKLKGKAKQVKGAITGNQRDKLEGELEEAKGKIKEKVEDLKHDIRRPPK